MDSRDGRTGPLGDGSERGVTYITNVDEDVKDCVLTPNPNGWVEGGSEVCSCVSLNKFKHRDRGPWDVPTPDRLLSRTTYRPGFIFTYVTYLLTW